MSSPTTAMGNVSFMILVYNSPRSYVSLMHETCPYPRALVSFLWGGCDDYTAGLLHLRYAQTQRFQSLRASLAGAYSPLRWGPAGLFSSHQARGSGEFRARADIAKRSCAIPKPWPTWQPPILRNASSSKTVHFFSGSSRFHRFPAQPHHNRSVTNYDWKPFSNHRAENPLFRHTGCLGQQLERRRKHQPRPHLFFLGAGLDLSFWRHHRYQNRRQSQAPPRMRGQHSASRNVGKGREARPADRKESCACQQSQAVSLRER